MPETVDEAQARYHAALHAMQSGVAMKMNYDAADTGPKHLRVGVNSAMAEHAALVTLLVSKHVISWEEYYTSLADAMEYEKAHYEAELRERFGNDGIDLR